MPAPIRSLIAAACLTAFALGAALPPAPAAAAAIFQADSGDESGGLLDEIVFNDGRILRGRVLDETNTTVKFEGELNGIPLSTTFQKADITAIRRGVAPAPEPEADTPRRAEPARSVPNAPTATSENAASVYVIELEGRFTSDIHEAPIRDALEDARDYQPDYLIVKVNNEWFERQFDDSNEVNTFTAPDQLFTAEELEPLFTEEIRDTWAKQPQLVFWVHNAMGGAAFMPFFSETIYFHPEGKIGGLGFVDELFNGDDSFNAKQISLRMGHARGVLIARGYEPMLADALMRQQTVLSYKLDGGNAVYFNRMPENDGEFLLTDNGQGENTDTLQDVVRGRVNDILELDAETARRLGVSKGTAETLDDLLFELGINRDYTLIDGRAERIMQSWSRRVRRAVQELPKMWEEYEEAARGRDFTPQQLRGYRIRKLEEIRGVLLRLQGAVPGPAVGLPSVQQIEQIIAQIKLEGLRG